MDETLDFQLSSRNPFSSSSTHQSHHLSGCQVIGNNSSLIFLEKLRLWWYWKSSRWISAKSACLRLLPLNDFQAPQILSSNNRFTSLRSLESRMAFPDILFLRQPPTTVVFRGNSPYSTHAQSESRKYFWWRHQFLLCIRARCANFFGLDFLGRASFFLITWTFLPTRAFF